MAPCPIRIHDTVFYSIELGEHTVGRQIMASGLNSLQESLLKHGTVDYHRHSSIRTIGHFASILARHRSLSRSLVKYEDKADPVHPTFNRRAAC